MIIGLTGGTGFIGKHLLKKYKDKYKFVVATSKATEKDTENIKYLQTDYSEKSFEECFSGCDALINLGATRSTPELEQSISNYFVNITSTENLLNAACTLGITNIVSISSRAVYSDMLALPYTEEVTLPLSKYGLSKLYCDNLCSYYNSHTNLNIKVLRLSQVLGLGEIGGYLLTTFIENCLNQKPLCIYGKGSLKRDYIYIEDVIDGIINAVEHKTQSGIFNLGSGVQTSTLELAQTFCKVFDNKAGYKNLVDKKEFGEDTLLDMTKCQQILGFTPKYTIEKAVIDIRNKVSNNEE